MRHGAFCSESTGWLSGSTSLNCGAGATLEPSYTVRPIHGRVSIPVAHLATLQASLEPAECRHVYSALCQCQTLQRHLVIRGSASCVRAAPVEETDVTENCEKCRQAFGGNKGMEYLTRKSLWLELNEALEKKG